MMQNGSRRTTIVTLISALLVLGMTACGTQTAGSSDSKAGANPKPTESTNISLSWPITFHRTGGIAGVDNKLTVEQDGTATLVGRGSNKFSCTVEPTTMSAITEEAKAAKARAAKKPSEKKDLPSKQPVADAFNYILKINGQEYRFTNGETIPKPVRPLISAMNDVLLSAIAVRDDTKGPKDTVVCTS